MVKGLSDIYQKHENFMISDKMSSKSRAVTDILEFQNKKNALTTAFYSW
jgi:hypothetical protein